MSRHAYIDDRKVEITGYHFEFEEGNNYIEDAYYVDTGEPLTHSELDQLTEACQDIICEEWLVWRSGG